jgi:hypothetical protein
VSDSFKIQQNVKVGNDLINLRADSPSEFESIANWVIENAGLLVNVQSALGGVSAVAPLAGNVTKTQVQNDAPAQAVQQQGQWAQPQQQAAPSWSQPATAGPACKHGPMVARGGEKNGRAWSGFFCPTPKGTPDQCPPQFGKG